MDPRHRRPADRRRPDRGRQDRRRRAEHRRRRRGDRLHRPHRHPRLRRHPPAHLGGGDPRLRAQRHARRLLRRGARHLRAALPPRGRVRQQPRRSPGVPQRRHHHAGRLVPHQQHPRAPGRRPSRRCRRPASGPSTPTAAPTSRSPTTGSTARSPFPATTCGASATRTSPPTAACSRWGWPPAGPASAQDDVVTVRVGPRPRAGHPDHRARRDGPAGRPVRHGQAARTTSACSGPDTTYIHCCYFSEEEWQLVADTGGTVSIAPQVETADGPRLAAGDKAMRVRAAAEPVDRRRHHRARRHVHPDPRGLRRRAGPGQRGVLAAGHAGPEGRC